MKHFFASVLALYLFVGSACYGASYAIDYAQSRIGFSGTHAEADFSGTFGRWNGKIIFDPDDLPASSIHVEIEMPSAVTGNPMFDGTLPNEDWFKVKEYPKATYTSETITANSDGSYTAKGSLQIKDRKVPLLFSFTLSDLKSPPVRTHFTLVLDRLALGIGAASDPKAEWVSRDIELDITLMAHPL